jgi:hypothetical protein
MGHGEVDARRIGRVVLATLFGIAIALAAALLLTNASSGSAATPVVCAPTPNPAGTGYWTTFGDATWTADGLQTSSQSDPSQPYGVTCGGASVYGNALPTTDPSRISALSFDFNPNQTGPSGTSPRLIVCFSDGSSQCDSNGSLAPTVWTANTWTHVDGFSPPTGLNAAWTNAGGTCGTTYNTTWGAIVACHPGASITIVAVVNDSGSHYTSGEQVLLNNLTVNNVVAHGSPPVFGKSAEVAPATGHVMVRRPGAKRYRELKTVGNLPYGTLVNAGRGNLKIIAAKRGAGTQSGNFYDGSFKVTQGRDGFVQAALVGGPSHCRSREVGRAASGRSFSLWGHVHGHFRTRGHYGSASVRGTVWFTQNLCDGTFFHVVKGTLRIHDFTRHRVVILRAGHSYLAPARPKKRPTDSDGDHDGD